MNRKVKLRALKAHNYLNRKIQKGQVYTPESTQDARFLVMVGCGSKLPEEEQQPSADLIEKKEPETAPEAVVDQPKKRRGRKKKADTQEKSGPDGE